ncbi:MAG: SCO family protein [Candidatus Omnitrophica bacterium]|nr:SCO family protein [Candidatus Omnitrophota bacterium]
MKTKNIISILILLSLVGFIGFGYFLLKREMGSPKLPVLGEVKDFKLINSKNEPFDSRSLDNKIWIVNFFFTTCGDICPILSKNMGNLSRTFELVKDVTLVSITVNPEQDTPEVLADYSQKYRTNQNWFFLTGEREDIKDILVNSMKIGDIKEPIFHSNRFILIDRYGYIRGYYNGTNTGEVNQLFKDAAALVKEKKFFRKE